jgi:hypothetical protein
MNFPITVLWSTGLLVLIGSLCTSNPAPLFGGGIAMLVTAAWMLLRGVNRIRSNRPGAFGYLSLENLQRWIVGANRRGEESYGISTFAQAGADGPVS